VTPNVKDVMVRPTKIVINASQTLNWMMMGIVNVKEAGKETIAMYGFRIHKLRLSR